MKWNCQKFGACGELKSLFNIDFLIEKVNQKFGPLSEKIQKLPFHFSGVRKAMKDSLSIMAIYILSRPYYKITPLVRFWICKTPYYKKMTVLL